MFEGVAAVAAEETEFLPEPLRSNAFVTDQMGATAFERVVRDGM